MEAFAIFGVSCFIGCFAIYCAVMVKVNKFANTARVLFDMLNSAEKCAYDLQAVSDGLRMQIREIDRQMGAINEVLKNEEPGRCG